MPKIKCFDIASMVIEEASTKFAPQYLKDEERYEILREYCNAMDIVMDEIEAESLAVDVDENTMDILFEVTSVDITLYNANSMMLDLIDRAKQVSVCSCSGGDMIKMFLVFPPIWTHI